RSPRIRALQLPQPLHEVALGKPSEIILRVRFELHSALRGCPLYVVFPLCEVTVEKCAEPRCSSKLQWPVTTGLCFQAIPGELVRAGRDHHSGSEFRRRK